MALRVSAACSCPFVFPRGVSGVRLFLDRRVERDDFCTLRHRVRSGSGSALSERSTGEHVLARMHVHDRDSTVVQSRELGILRLRRARDVHLQFSGTGRRARVPIRGDEAIRLRARSERRRPLTYGAPRSIRSRFFVTRDTSATSTRMPSAAQTEAHRDADLERIVR